jgi:hypothetical protein
MIFDCFQIFELFVFLDFLRFFFVVSFLSYNIISLFNCILFGFSNFFFLGFDVLLWNIVIHCLTCKLFLCMKQTVIRSRNGFHLKITCVHLKNNKIQRIKFEETKILDSKIKVTISFITFNFAVLISNRDRTKSNFSENNSKVLLRSFSSSLSSDDSA